MVTVPEQSVFSLLLAVPRAKPRPFIPSMLVCRDTQKEFTALCHHSSELSALQVSFLSGPVKEKGSLLWGKNSLFLMVDLAFGPLTANCFEIVTFQ